MAEEMEDKMNKEIENLKKKYESSELTRDIINLLVEEKWDGVREWDSANLIRSIDYDIKNVGEDFYRKKMAPKKSLSIGLCFIYEDNFNDAKKWLEESSINTASLCVENMQLIHDILHEVYEKD